MVGLLWTDSFAEVVVVVEGGSADRALSQRLALKTRGIALSAFDGVGVPAVRAVLSAFSRDGVEVVVETVALLAGSAVADGSCALGAVVVALVALLEQGVVD